MTWWAVEVPTDDDNREPIGAWLVGQTGAAVEERADGTLVACVEGEAAAVALLRSLDQAHAVRGRRMAVEQVDWAIRWRDGIAPRKFGRLTVAPSWARPAVEAQESPLVVIDPESAFGSGEHGSTRSALRLLERRLRPGDRVLDLGTGSGILAIAAVRLGAGHATGVEVDGEALAIARRNVERNGVADRVRLVEAEAALAPLLGPADLVLSNILRSVNETLLRPIRAALRPGGTAIFAGMEDAEAPVFQRALAAHGFGRFEEEHDTGWWAIAAIRP